MKAQVSMEYLILLGIALGLLIPGVIFFYAYSQSSGGNSANSRITGIGQEMTSKAETTYGYGIGVQSIEEWNLPEGTNRVYASGNELVVVYDTAQGPAEAVFFSTVALNGTNPDGSYNADGNISTHPGLTRFRFVSRGSTVAINEME